MVAITVSFVLLDGCGGAGTRAAQSGRRPAVGGIHLHLGELISVDAVGLEALHGLRSAGAQLLEVPAYIQLKLDFIPPETVSAIVDATLSAHRPSRPNHSISSLAASLAATCAAPRPPYLTSQAVARWCCSWRDSCQRGARPHLSDFLARIKRIVRRSGRTVAAGSPGVATHTTMLDTAAGYRPDVACPRATMIYGDFMPKSNRGGCYL